MAINETNLWADVGVCVGILSAATMSRDFWAGESEWGPVYLTQSQLRPLCHAEIREEEAFI